MNHTKTSGWWETTWEYWKTGGEHVELAIKAGATIAGVILAIRLLSVHVKRLGIEERREEEEEKKRQDARVEKEEKEFGEALNDFCDEERLIGLKEGRRLRQLRKMLELSEKDESGKRGMEVRSTLKLFVDRELALEAHEDVAASIKGGGRDANKESMIQVELKKLVKEYLERGRGNGD